MSGVAGRVRLLPPDALVKTGPIDHAAWNHAAGLLGYVSRQRFELVASLLPKRPLDRVLEIGYGSGVFIPELATRAARVSGIDSHDRAETVSAVLARAGIAADLVRARAEDLPFADATFDAVIAVSALEFVSDVDAAVREISRVLRPNGFAIVVTPGDNLLLDFALRVTTGASARRDFGDRRARVRAALAKNMRVAKVAAYPRFSPIVAYRAFVMETLAPRQSSVGDRKTRGEVS